MRVLFAVLLCAAGAVAQLPDLKRTPGATNPDITQDNIRKTICNPKWSTKSIRPPSSYTDKLKKDQMDVFGLKGKPSDYEEDHLISLEIGGSPTDPLNLWPEAYARPLGARQKDRVENALHREVCAGTITLKRAQGIIVQDWVECFKKLGKKQICK